MDEQLLEIARRSIWSKEQVKEHIDKVFESAKVAQDRDAYIRETMETMWTTATTHFAIEKCYRALTGGLSGETADQIRKAMFTAGKEKGYK